MNDITIRRPVKWLSSSASDPGALRETNEDAVLNNSQLGLWLVADGMGGHEAGQVASNMIVESMRNLPVQTSLAGHINSLEERLKDVNQRLLEYSEIMLDGRIVGSTFVGFTIFGQVGVCMWMGDSRLYRFRGGELQQLTRDHSQVEELLQMGAISEEEAASHPDSNVITRAIGTNDEAYIDYELVSVQAGDLFLLCSDGLYNALNELELVDCLKREDLDSIVRDMVSAANDNNAADNVSVVLIKGVLDRYSEFSVQA